MNWHWRSGEIEHVLAWTRVRRSWWSTPTCSTRPDRLCPTGSSCWSRPRRRSSPRPSGSTRAAAGCPTATPTGAADWPGSSRGPGPGAGAAVSMIYTSGTTGKPKGVRRAPFTAEQVASLVEVNEQVLGVVPGMRTLIPAPMYHSFGNALAVSALLVRAQVVLQPRFEPQQLLALIEAHRVLLRLPRRGTRALRPVVAGACHRPHRAAGTAGPDRGWPPRCPPRSSTRRPPARRR
ncbi:MAG: AMP-binding protein [Acidimicrobiales bacterium]